MPKFEANFDEHITPGQTQGCFTLSNSIDVDTIYLVWGTGLVASSMLTFHVQNPKTSHGVSQHAEDMFQVPFQSSSQGANFDPSPKKMSYCDVCGKSFVDYYSVRRHKKASHDNVTHSCVCGRSYKYSSDLTKHMKRCPVYQATM